MSKKNTIFKQLSDEANSELPHLRWRLRLAYRDVLEAPIPERFFELIGELDFCEGEKNKD